MLLESVNTHMKRHTNTHKSLLSESLALCGPCPRSQAAVCMAASSVASHWGGGGGKALPLHWWESQLQPQSSCSNEWRGRESAVTHRHHHHRVLSPYFNQPHLLQRETRKCGSAALPSMAGSYDRCCTFHTTAKNKRSRHVQRRTRHGAYRGFCTCDDPWWTQLGTYTNVRQRACMSCHMDRDNLYCSVL